MQKIFGPLGMVIAFIIVAVLAYPQLSKIAGGIAPLIAEVPKVVASTPLPFSLPDGFTAYIYALDTPGARVLARDPKGTLVVSLPKNGTVVAVPDKNADGLSDGAVVLVKSLHNPHGLAFSCGAEDGGCFLYIAEEDTVGKYAYDSEKLTAEFREEITSLPGNDGHYTRTLLMHPDGKRLLVSVGSSCNVCNEEDTERAAILAVTLKTKEKTIFAKGLRNTVFMARNPADANIWGTENGRDLLDDDIPPDEINILKEGNNYGWPVCYGKNIHDTDFDKNTYIRNPCMEPFEIPSQIDIQAHSAPLGLAFIPEKGWPEEYKNDLLVAYHGSWNRSVPTGYKIVRYDYDKKTKTYGAAADFMTGFLKGAEAIGRPVDIRAEENGVLFVSDDRAGVVYRILYREPTTESEKAAAEL